MVLEEPGEEPEGRACNGLYMGYPEDELTMAYRFHGPDLFEFSQENPRCNQPYQSRDQKDHRKDKGGVPRPGADCKFVGKMTCCVPAGQGPKQYKKAIHKSLIGDATCPFRGCDRVKEEIHGRKAETRPYQSAIDLDNHKIKDSRGEEPKHRNYRYTPSAHIQYLFRSEPVTQTTPVPEGEKLGDRGDARDQSKFQIGEP